MLNLNTLFAGRYGVISKIGSGGMADVYKVKDVQEDKIIALKVLKDSFAKDPRSVKRFRMEGSQASRISSPNVVNVYDVGSFNGTNYIAMELVNGITLKEYVRRKNTLGAKETLAISAQIACGLRAAHAKQIVHKDIKPENIILSRDGKVKLTDFGIADSIEGNEEKGNFTMGSVYYMAPEQAKGESCDERSDIYSLGIVMYEMITGRVPFDKDTSVAVALAHMNESMIPPSEVNPDCPLALEQIIFRCTQKSASRRYHNCTELIADLKIAVNSPDYNFEKKEKATLLKSSTQIFEKPSEKKTRRPVEETEEESPRAAVAPRRHERSEDEKEVRAAKAAKSKKLPRTLFDKILSGGAAVVGAVSICLLVYIILSLSGCISNRGLTKPSTSESTPEDVILETKDASDFDPETDAKVPNVIGLQLKDAIEKLEKANLKYKISSAIEYSDEYPLGTILKQSYLEGTVVAKGSTIVILMSAGTDKFVVKRSYVGGRIQDFRNDIAKLSDIINVEYDRKTSNTIPANTIMSITVNGQPLTQDITVTKGAKIVVVYSGGKPTVTVPKLLGMTQDEAVRALEDVGLFLGNVTEAYSDDYPKETICGQDPINGRSVANGSQISIVISLGPESLSVPSVTDEEGNRKDYNTYVSELSEKGIHFETIKIYDAEHGAESDANGNNYIVKVSPEAGTQVEGENFVVKVYVATADESASDSTGLGSGLEETKQKIQELGYTVGSVIEVATHTETKAGTVWKTDPAAGALTVENNTVNIYLYQFVPNLVGLTMDEIEARKGLYEVVFEAHETNGKCVSQSITENTTITEKVITVTMDGIPAESSTEPSSSESPEPSESDSSEAS